ncbi:(Fe-S)-binding protein [Beggiatoa leptomitoformis]|uniref:(Fe-S)-binding protein n=1 Tax=Beggiatoa leptomitoformis TaxID=288004 RepID=A0A2N9YGD0_9GAMM|nr:(Fe-S)-binding protein [Beggiatoa leptomitoformis]ALG68407.1 (Fe-S)-binding protein [Beggiatoa leptomitoformis]AUI69266.1 (Fe-S)-binding protein [Beggiatoa leptomitoformis]
MKTFLDWSAYENAGMGDAYADIPKTGGDFAKAVAVCINSRQCENKEQGKGVMCPSFRVSDIVHNSTGGRVRLLKAALNGELGNTPFTDPVLAEAMDLCVACKGCKRECENAVDMAMIKIEYLAQRNALTGLSWRTRFFASTPLWLHRYKWLKPLPAWRNRWSWLAQLGEKFLGISAKRRLPEPVTTPFSQPLTAETIEQKVGSVVLFVDTFTRYFDPSVIQDAVQVLQTAKYHVIIAEPNHNTIEPDRPLCCGRTFIAHGMVEEAKAEAERVLNVLLPHAEAGRTIIGLEPPCLLALRDDYKSLGLGKMAEKVAQHSILFEEFLARELTAKRLKLPLKPLVNQIKPMLIQGHCHQHAVGAMKSMRKILKLIPDFQFQLLDPACCGMAGSFGLEAEHADVALQMAEQALLPALRANPDAPILANGFSCRQQILENGGGQKPIHLATLLRESLG